MPPPTAPHESPSLHLRRLQTDAWLALSRIHRRLTERSERLLAAEALEGVTPAQAGALMVLFQARGPLTGARVAEELGITEVTVGRFLRALEDGGWVERTRSTADARAVLVRPSAKAYEALPRFIAVSNAVLDNTFAGFSPADIEALGATIRRVEDNLDAPSVRGGSS